MAAVLPFSFARCRLACRDFEAKNPAVTQLDRFQSARKDPRSTAAVFAAEQVRAMQADRTEAEAYDLARTWLLERGPQTLARMGVLVDGKTAGSLEAAAYADAMAKQSRAMRQALRKDLLARQAYRSFIEPEEALAIASRALSAEPVFPRDADSEEEGGGDATSASTRAGGDAETKR